MKRTTLAMMMTLALTTTAVAANDWKDGAKDAWIDGKAETTLLLNGNLNSFDINTDVKNGNVTLTGKVESEVDKALAEELIENLEGVTDVDNQLTVVNTGKNADSKDKICNCTLIFFIVCCIMCGNADFSLLVSVASE